MCVSLEKCLAALYTPPHATLHLGGPLAPVLPQAHPGPARLSAALQAAGALPQGGAADSWERYWQPNMQRLAAACLEWTPEEEQADGHRVEAPDAAPSHPTQPSVSLASSIEMGRAELWQDEVAAALRDEPLTILNPRRDDWDASWEQSSTNPQFVAQVSWELDAEERADLIAMYFAPETSAPITLLELGLFAASGKLRVYCPPGYWRKGNVDVVCAGYGIPQIPTLAELCSALIAWSEQQGRSAGA
jgi:hypothetical protein